VWLLGSPERLSARARAAILQARNTGEDLGYSPVSLYEIAYAAHRNRLCLNASIGDTIAAMERLLKVVPLSASIAICAAELPDHFHGDPIDLMIAATAIIENCVL